nr:hypothetical protein [Tanacetum cinerariifolium]
NLLERGLRPGLGPEIHPSPWTRVGPIQGRVIKQDAELTGTSIARTFQHDNNIRTLTASGSLSDEYGLCCFGGRTSLSWHVLEELGNKPATNVTQ